MIEWNNLDLILRNSKNLVFKNSILKFISPSPSNVFNCDNRKDFDLTHSWAGVELFALAQIQAQFSRLFKSTLQLWFRYRIYLTFPAPMPYI